MNITLSQAGMKPITISTESGYRSQEFGMDPSTQMMMQMQMQEQQRIAQEQARLAQQQADEESRRIQEGQQGSADLKSKQQQYNPLFDEDRWRGDITATDISSPLGNIIDGTPAYQKRNDENERINNQMNDLNRFRNDIQNDDMSSPNNIKFLSKAKSLINDQGNLVKDMHKDALDYKGINKDDIKESMDNLYDEDKDLDEYGLTNKRIGSQYMTDLYSDPNRLVNESQSLSNEDIGRAMSDSYRAQAANDDPNAEYKKSIGGMPSNLAAGTANGSYIPTTYFDPETGEARQLDVRENNSLYGVATGQKDPHFMTDDELNFYEQKILDAPSKSEPAKTYLSSIQQEKARRKQAVDNERNELRMPSDARAGMNGEARPTADARPLKDPNANANNNVKIAAGAGLIALGAIAAKFLTGTIFNKVTSIGKFTSGNEMLSSPAFNQKLQLIARKFPGPYPTVQDVKASPNARNKDTFMGWLLGGNMASKHLDTASTGTLIKNTQLGIPVAITTISSTQSLQALSGAKLLLANAFVNKNGQLTSIPVARGFLTKGSMVNASREAADIFFNARGQKFNKAQIKYLADKSYESFGPNPDFEAKIIDWYCL